MTLRSLLFTLAAISLSLPVAAPAKPPAEESSSSAKAKTAKEADAPAKESTPAPASAKPAITGLPEAPLKIKTPAEPPSTIQKVELKTKEIPLLLEYMGMALEGDQKDDAYAFLFWAQRRMPTGGGMSLLAQLCAMRDKTDDALYWLQRAVLEDRFHEEEIAANEIFKKVREDERYAKLKKFAVTAKEAWKKTGHRREVVTLPKGSQPGTPLPVLVALHGLGSEPEDFGGPGEAQNLADSLGAAIVSISGTEPWGKNSFSWSENFETDWAHIQKTLESVKDRVTPQPGKCIAAGFSQGGQLAAELAAAHPEFFAGAIVLSPGYEKKKRLEDAIKAGGDKIASQWYFITWMSGEHKDTVETAREAEKLLTGAKARVISHAFTGDTHSFPPNHEDHFAIWGKLILSGKP